MLKCGQNQNLKHLCDESAQLALQLAVSGKAQVYKEKRFTAHCLLL